MCQFLVSRTDWRPQQRRNRVTQSPSQLLEQRPTPSRRRIQEPEAVWGSGAVWGRSGRRSHGTGELSFEEGHRRELRTEVQVEGEGKDAGLKGRVGTPGTSRADSFSRALRCPGPLVCPALPSAHSEKSRVATASETSRVGLSSVPNSSSNLSRNSGEGGRLRWVGSESSARPWAQLWCWWAGGGPRGWPGNPA